MAPTPVSETEVRAEGLKKRAFFLCMCVSHCVTVRTLYISVPRDPSAFSEGMWIHREYVSGPWM